LRVVEQAVDREQLHARIRAEHPDYEPDLNFKKAKAEAEGEQQTLI
jgi:hypothetical protein